MGERGAMPPAYPAPPGPPAAEPAPAAQPAPATAPLRGAMPPAPAVHAALRKITETLAAELACPSGTAPAWSQVEWTLAKAVAAMHGVSSLLCRSASWAGGAGWREFLEQQRAHIANRHVRILALLDSIDRRAREDGIAAVPLKGAALHAMGLYAPGDRPMADVDILVRPEDAERAARLIESLGYRESGASRKERAFAPVEETAAARLGEHSNNAIKIELHEGICARLPQRLTDISSIIIDSRQEPGLNAYPSRAALMIHLLLHAAGDMAFKTLRLVQLRDIALLASRMTVSDWDELLGYRADKRLWWASPPLGMVRLYFASALPARVLEALELDCPRHLRWISQRRTLSDVSFSHLWVEALPGIEWSRGPVEMLEYALARIRPGGRVLALRGTLAATQAWASDREWSRLSQGRRIFTWLTSRPARPVTLHAVRAAFGA